MACADFRRRVWVTRRTSGSAARRARPHETPLVTLAERMASERVHCIVMLMPGLDPDEQIPWSVVSDLDVLRRAAMANELTAGDVVSAELVLVYPGQSLSEAAGLMARRAVTHAVVVIARTANRSASCRAWT
jgi:CBS domain-containing protein